MRTLWSRALAGAIVPALLLLAATMPAAQEAESEEVEELSEGVTTGDEAPAFQAKDDAGKLWKSSDHVGRKILVVYFYPAAMTGGCTKQACGFRDDRDVLSKMGVDVVGVSGDSVEGQALFKRANHLNFTLLADPEGAVAGAFGVPTREGGSIKRTVDGREVTLTRGVTASRWTFVIDQEGFIAYVNSEVKAAEDSKDVIEVVQSLLAEDEEEDMPE